MEVEEEIKEVRKIGKEDSRGGGMVLVILESREAKKMMQAKKKLRGRKERIRR